MQVLFRADATPSIGTGHVMRCWALAEELQHRGWDVRWQGTVDVPWLRSAFQMAQWRVDPPESPGQIGADLVVVDSYTLPLTYRQTLLDRRLPVLVILDDSHRQLGPGTLWVNPGAPAPLGNASRFLNGPEYVLIRREIHELRHLRQVTRPLQGVTFLLGGTDFAAMHSAVDHIELPVPTYAGPGQGSGSTVHWLAGGSDLLQRAATSRLVVSAAGVSCWEMLHVGVPLALVAVAENQRGNYSWLVSENWAVGLGDDFGEPHIVRATLDRDLPDVSRLDGLGAVRVADAVLANC